LGFDHSGNEGSLMRIQPRCAAVAGSTTAALVIPRPWSTAQHGSNLNGEESKR
jgi:hypothetical protein